MGGKICVDEMLSLWDQEVQEGLLYVTIGKAVVQYAEQLKGSLLREAMHDEAVSILAEIYRMLQDPELDDEACMERIESILMLYARRLDLLPQRHAEQD